MSFLNKASKTIRTLRAVAQTYDDDRRAMLMDHIARLEEQLGQLETLARQGHPRGYRTARRLLQRMMEDAWGLIMRYRSFMTPLARSPRRRRRQRRSRWQLVLPLLLIPAMAANIGHLLEPITLADAPIEEARVRVGLMLSTPTERNLAMLSDSLHTWTWRMVTSRYRGQDLWEWHELIRRSASVMKPVAPDLSVRTSVLGDFIVDQLSYRLSTLPQAA